jgi:hypothetical protein
MSETACNHQWEEYEDWIFNGEDEEPVLINRCNKCYERMTADIVNAQLATLRALLAEVAPKCVQCGEIATAVGGLFSAQSGWCEQHRRVASLDYDLGRRIRDELEGKP